MCYLAVKLTLYMWMCIHVCMPVVCSHMAGTLVSLYIVYMYVVLNCIVMLEFRIEVHLHVVTCRHSGASVTLAVVSINIVHVHVPTG